MRIVCSAEADAEHLFEISAVSSKQVEDKRQLMDDLGISEVSTIMFVKALLKIRG